MVTDCFTSVPVSALHQYRWVLWSLTAALVSLGPSLLLAICQPVSVCGVMGVLAPVGMCQPVSVCGVMGVLAPVGMCQCVCDGCPCACQPVSVCDVMGVLAPVSLCQCVM